MLLHVHGIRHVLTFTIDDFKNLPDVVAAEPGSPIPERLLQHSRWSAPAHPLSSPVSAEVAAVETVWEGSQSTGHETKSRLASANRLNSLSFSEREKGFEPFSACGKRRENSGKTLRVLPSERPSVSREILQPGNIGDQRRQNDEQHRNEQDEQDFLGAVAEHRERCAASHFALRVVK